MDPITHTTLGSLTAYAVLGRRLGRHGRGAGALFFGAAGGALPDIDVLWGSLADPALPWEHHRHFTHALAFIPVAGLLAVAPLLLLFKRYRPQAGMAYLAATIGCATHGVNDALTSFGTFLYWPLSNARVSWDLISIIDPIFTLTLILGIALGLIFASARPARITLSLAALYLSLAFVQQQRVLGVQRELAAARGHEIERGRAMPTFGNIIIWRSLYEADGMLYTDAVRASPFSSALVRRGETISRVRAEDVHAARTADPRRHRRNDLARARGGCADHRFHGGSHPGGFREVQRLRGRLHRVGRSREWRRGWYSRRHALFAALARVRADVGHRDRTVPAA